MEIKNYNSSYLPKSLSFKGYDARELKGLMFTDKSSADAVRKAAKEIDLDIYTPNIASKSIQSQNSTIISTCLSDRSRRGRFSLLTTK